MVGISASYGTSEQGVQYGSLTDAPHPMLNSAVLFISMGYIYTPTQLSQALISA
jgi:hypothetical protein